MENPYSEIVGLRVHEEHWLTGGFMLPFQHTWFWRRYFGNESTNAPVAFITATKMTNKRECPCPTHPPMFTWELDVNTVINLHDHDTPKTFVEGDLGPDKSCAKRFAKRLVTRRPQSVRCLLEIRDDGLHSMRDSKFKICSLPELQSLTATLLERNLRQ